MESVSLQKIRKIPDCIVKQSRKKRMRHANEAKEERAKYTPFSLILSPFI